jgi:hypothetical protein
MDMNRRMWMKASGLMAAGTLVAGRGGAAETAQQAGAGEVVLQRKLPIKYDVDVFVAGGGPAGAAAAVAARSQGARVFLAEAHTCLGGMGTAGRVPVFMPLSDGVNFLPGGFGRRVIDRLAKEKALPGPATDVEALKRVYDELVSESGAAFSFYTTLSAVEAEGGRVRYVVCASPSGLFAVRAKVYVDATGNGDLAMWAGAAFEKGDAQGRLMPGTLCSVWSGVDWKTWIMNRPKGPQPDGSMLEKAFADGVFTVQDRHLTGMHDMGCGLAGGNIGHAFNVDGTDERSLTQALVEGRKSMTEYARYYREYLKGFEQVKLVQTGSLMGIRETRRITGDYTLCIADYKKRAVFSDEIGRYAYAIDIHPGTTDAASYEKHRKEFDKEYRYNKGESYGVPYRVLTPKGLDNVLVAGRCVCTDQLVHGSLRVMPGCFITGQAAGMAAAMAADHGASVHGIDVKDLQRRLKAFGAYLPNA